MYQLNRFRVAHRRAYVLAESIAAEIAKNAAILNLRTPRLVSDIRERFQCCHSTAMVAVQIAREAA